jgi:hypothetical protein
LFLLLTLFFFFFLCSALWANGDKKATEDEAFLSIVPPANFCKWMKLYRFKHFRTFVTAIWEDATTKETDPWWQFEPAVKEFNNLRQERVVSAVWEIVDETMSAWRPRTTPLGGLPNISNIKRKPEP